MVQNTASRWKQAMRWEGAGAIRPRKIQEQTQPGAKRARDHVAKIAEFIQEREGGRRETEAQPLRGRGLE